MADLEAEKSEASPTAELSDAHPREQDGPPDPRRRSLSAGSSPARDAATLARARPVRPRGSASPSRSRTTCSTSSRTRRRSARPRARTPRPGKATFPVVWGVERSRALLAENIAEAVAAARALPRRRRESCPISRASSAPREVVKAFVQTGVGQVRGARSAGPAPGAGEVVLRVRTALTCGTDLKLLSRGHARIAPAGDDGPRALRRGRRGRRGRRRGWTSASASCPASRARADACADCRRGARTSAPPGTRDRTWGAFAEFVRVPAGRRRREPPPRSRRASTTKSRPSSIRSRRSSTAGTGCGAPSGSMLVYGAGALAFLWAAVARGAASKSLIAGRRPERAALAAAVRRAIRRPLGAGDPAAARSTSPWTARAIATVWERLAELVRPGGQVLLFGGCAPGARVGFDAARLHYARDLPDRLLPLHAGRGPRGARRARRPARSIRARSSRSAERSRICRAFSTPRPAGEGVRYAIAVRS